MTWGLTLRYGGPVRIYIYGWLSTTAVRVWRRWCIILTWIGSVGTVCTLHDAIELV